MEFVNKSLSVSNRFPSAISQRIAYPIHQIIDLVAHNFRIANNSYVVFGAVNKLDGRRRWNNTIRNGRDVARFQKRAMKDGVKPHV